MATISEQVKETFNIGNCEVCVPDDGGQLCKTADCIRSNPTLSEVLLHEVFQSGEMRDDAGHDADLCSA